jgi:5-deoxy-glucuronate isomerase
VVNRAGRWSSYPPHHHPHPEIYHYRFFPHGGFGYCGQGPEVYRVHDGDTAAIAPDLAHPQVAAPGYTMIYVWAIRHLEGNRFGSGSRIFEPEHTWVLDT